MLFWAQIIGMTQFRYVWNTEDYECLSLHYTTLANFTHRFFLSALSYANQQINYCGG